jgi:hypothetical protein
MNESDDKPCKRELQRMVLGIAICALILIGLKITKREIFRDHTYVLSGVLAFVMIAGIAAIFMIASYLQCLVFQNKSWRP